MDESDPSKSAGRVRQKTMSAGPEEVAAAIARAQSDNTESSLGDPFAASATPSVEEPSSGGESVDPLSAYLQDLDDAEAIASDSSSAKGLNGSHNADPFGLDLLDDEPPAPPSAPVQPSESLSWAPSVEEPTPSSASEAPAAAPILMGPPVDEAPAPIPPPAAPSKPESPPASRRALNFGGQPRGGSEERGQERQVQATSQREQRESREPREPREARETREPRESREHRESREQPRTEREQPRTEREQPRTDREQTRNERNRDQDRNREQPRNREQGQNQQGRRDGRDAPRQEPSRGEANRGEQSRGEQNRGGARPQHDESRSGGHRPTERLKPGKINAGRLFGWLVSYASPDGSAIELREGKFFVTQSSLKASDLVIDDPTVSTPHALMTVSGESGLYIQDLMSEHGVFVRSGEGQPYRREELSTQLKHGDWVRFGEVEFLVSLLPGRP